jgi:hypothetical protein
MTMKNGNKNEWIKIRPKRKRKGKNKIQKSGRMRRKDDRESEKK